MRFDSFLDEIIYKGKDKLSKNSFNDIDYNKDFISGGLFSLYKSPTHFILQKNDEIVFYLEYEYYAKTKTYILGARENVSKYKKLFFRIIFALLLEGFKLKEDSHHNDLSLKSIHKLVDSAYIEVLYNDKEIEDFGLFDDNDVNKTFTYYMARRRREHLVENWINGTVHDTIEMLINQI